MADSDGGGSGLKKKYGPLPVWGWVAAGAGAFLIYRYIRSRQAANSALAALGTTGGTTIPAGTTQTTGPTTGVAGTFSSVSAWEQAALTYLTGNGMSNGDALSAITRWLNGNCVSQTAYNDLAAALVSSSVGLPPGYTNIPTLSVCPSPAQTPPPAKTPAPPSPAPAPPPPAPTSPGPPPNLPSNVVNAMIANGERLVDTAYNPYSHTWLYLTNRGGVYAEGGSGFFGSLFDLPASVFTGTGRQAERIIPNADGGYTVVDTWGESYTFGPSANYAGK